MKRARSPTGDDARPTRIPRAVSRRGRARSQSACRAESSPGRSAAGHQPLGSLPLPRPPIGLIGVRHAEQTTICWTVRSAPGLVALLAAKDQAPSVSLQHDDFALRCFVEKTKPVAAGFRGGGPFFSYKVKKKGGGGPPPP